MAPDRLRWLGGVLALLLVGPVSAGDGYVVGSDRDPDARSDRDLGPRLVDLQLLRSHEYSDRFAVENVAVSPNGREVAAISKIARVGVKAWEVDSGRSLKLPGIPERATAVAYDSRMRSVAASVEEDLLGGNPGGVDVYDLDSGRSPPPLEGANDVSDLAFSPDDRVLVAASESGVVGWDLSDGRPVQILEQRGGADGVSFLSSDQIMVSSGGGALLMRVNVTDGRVEESWEGRGAAAACLSPDGKFVAMAGSDGIRILDLWGGGKAQIVPTEGEITALDWGASGTVLAAGTKSGLVLVFLVRGVRGLPTDPGPTRLGGRAVRVEESSSVDLNRGRGDGSHNPFDKLGRGGSGSGDGGGSTEAAPVEESRPEIVGEVKVLILDSFGNDPRTSIQMERSLRENLKKVEPCWKRESRRGNPAIGEMTLPLGVSAEGEGRGFGEPIADTVGNEKLRACIEEKLRGALFPPGLGSLDIELTLTLREEQ